MRTALVFYHFFFPDDVVSATLYADLCAGLVERGWDVTVMPSACGCCDASQRYSKRERWSGVKIRRVWRPPLRQSSGLGRVLNILWMIARWSLAAASRARPDILIIGTDPVLSVVVARVWRWLKPQTKIVHWCFDLYPEAAIAAGVLAPDGFMANALTTILKPAYAACDLIVDIGPCMRSRLQEYGSGRRTATLVPWALEEPAAVPPSVSKERCALFGNAPLALMYSGSFGRAHSHEDILDLARNLRGTGAELVFSVRGNRIDALRNAITTNDTNVSFVPFASEDNLEDRLAAADVHIVSLREEWTGAVVPSKFFGALAMGRPVIFCGSPQSAIARWIQEYGVGWVLAPGQAAKVAVQLCSVMVQPQEMSRLRERCHRVYHERFAKRLILDQWHKELCNLLSRPQTGDSEIANAELAAHR